MSSEPLHVYVHLPCGLDPAAWEGRYQRGTANDASPYGFHHARDLGYRVTLSTDAHGRFYRLFRYVLMRLCFSIDVVHAWHDRAAIRAADVVWTILDSEGMAIATLMKTGLVPSRPLIGNLVWAFNKWRRFTPPKRALYRRVLPKFSALTVHSAASLPASREALRGTGVDAELMYFGINTGAYVVTPPVALPDEGPLRILSIGNDPTRDWSTFLEAFGNDARFDVTLVAVHVKDEQVAHLSKVKLVRRPKMHEFRAMYARSQYVVVPMFANIFSGITVALEAAALGKPVISTRAGGVPTYFDETEMIYVVPGDAQAMRQSALDHDAAHRTRIAQRAQRRLLACDYSARGMIERYAALTDRVRSR